MSKPLLFQQTLRTSTSIQNISTEDYIRTPPQKIHQNKLTITYTKLQYIPKIPVTIIPSKVPPNNTKNNNVKKNKNIIKQVEMEMLLSLNDVKYINHLYLSHNNIKSLKGIEIFTQLVSLNLSYNCLTEISQLLLINKPDKLKRIGLKMNMWSYGYQDYAIKLFQSLAQLDDLHIQRQKIKQIQLIQQNIANYFIEYFLRINRVLYFMDDMISKDMLHSQMGLNKRQNKKVKQKLKLLFQNISQSFIAQASNLYVLPTEQDFRKLSSEQILTKIQAIIELALAQGIDLKCTCRPQLPLNQEIKQTYKEICQMFLQRFSLRYNKSLEKALERIQKQIKVKNPNNNYENWQLFGMLQNYPSLSSGGRRYENITNQQVDNYARITQCKNQDHIKQNKIKIKYHQINQFTKSLSKQLERHKISLNKNSIFDPKNRHKHQNEAINSYNFYEENKQNAEPNIAEQYLNEIIKRSKSFQQKKNPYVNQNIKNIKLQQKQQPFETFYERIPIIYYQKNYIEVLLEVTCLKIKKMLENFQTLVKRNKYLIEKEAVSSNMNEIYDKEQNISYSNKQRQINCTKYQKQNYSGNRNITPIQTSRNNIKIKHENKMFDTQAMLKSTLVNNSPYYQQELGQENKTTRPFLNRKDSQISFGAIDQRTQTRQINFQIYQINLIYKVFRSFKHYALQKKNNKKQKFNQNHL